MPREIVPSGPIHREGAILNAPMKIHHESGRIILVQKTRLWFRAVVSFWAMVVLMTPFMLYSEIFTSQTTRFECDRGTGFCAVDGRTKDVPRLADLTRAQMDHDFNRRDGANWGISLVTRDGKKHSIEEQRAIKDSVIAEYRASVKTINAFLADPTQQKLDTSFTYHAGLSEQLQSVFYLGFGAITLLFAFQIWTKRLYTFEPGRVTLITRHPFQRATREIPAERIAAVTERQTSIRRAVELKLDDTSTIAFVDAGAIESPANHQLAQELANLLGKPLET